MFEKKITFIAIEEKYENIWPHPQPASHFIPQNYKNLKRHEDNNLHKPTVKTCIPFLDALTSGYIIPFDQDYVVDATETDLSISSANKEPEPLDFIVNLSFRQGMATEKKTRENFITNG